MTDRKRLYLLILIMTGASLLVGGIAVVALYRAAMQQERVRVMESAQSQARLIEAVARFDAVESNDFPEGSRAATISQVVDAHKQYVGFGKTGEFTLARREGEQIVFVLSHRHSELENPEPVPWDGDLAEPMRRALMGESGTLIGLDYRGATVLAAYEPVAELDLGIVAKIDLAEVRQPFIRAGLLGVCSAVTVVVLASLVFMRVSSPLITSLQEQHARLQAILETAVDGIITIDQRGAIESFNPAAERMFGYPGQQVIGQNIKMLMPAPYCEEHDEYLANFLETGQKKIIGIGREVVGRRKDGRTFPMDLAVSEICAGRRRFFAGIVRDITDRKLAEQNRRLAEMGKMLSAIAHESRNALQRIQASVEMLRLELEGAPQVVDQLDCIEKANDSLTRLYEELRHYAAPLSLNREQCNLREIWLLAWANLGHLREGRQTELHDATNGMDMCCWLDEFRMEQVFRNLLENSLAACGDPVRIEIRCDVTQLAQMPAIRILYQDNGPGLSVEQRRRVFEPFFTTKSRGTGLGMAIAKRILDAHGAEVRVADDPRPGAKFEIVIPCQSQASPQISSGQVSS